jgi:tetratricopeptide (TPR) repeat protein
MVLLKQLKAASVQFDHLLAEKDFRACRVSCYSGIAQADARDERLRWLNNLSGTEILAGNFLTALAISRGASPLASESSDHFLKGNHHTNYAAALSCLGTHDEAFVEYAVAEYHYIECGREDLMASVQNNVGYLYVQLGQPVKALDYLERAREKYQRLEDWARLAEVHESIAAAYRAKAVL